MLETLRRGLPPARHRRRRIRELYLRFEAARDGAYETRIETLGWEEQGSGPFRPPVAPAATQQERGSQLFEALFTSDVRELFARSLGALRSPDILRLSFHLELLGPAPAAGLDRLPWELLRDRAGTTLALDPRFSIVRRPGLIGQLPAPRIQLPLEILIVVANPRGLLAGPHEANLIAESFRNSPSVHVTRVDAATTDRLGQALLNLARPVHILHFIGHGRVDPEGVGRLVFETAQGEPHEVKGDELRMLLGGHPELRLIVLNACRMAGLAPDSAADPAAARLDPALGVATSLLAAGVPAVIAMRYAISDRAAVEFSRGFYSRLAAGDPVDAAMVEGRRAILFKRPASAEWATPVLFLRGGDGYIFRVGARSWQRRTVVLESEQALAAPSRASTPQWVEAMAESLQIAASDLETEGRPEGQSLAVTLPAAAADRLLAAEQERDSKLVTLRLELAIDAIHPQRPEPVPLGITFALGVLGNLVAALIEREPWSESVTPGRIAALAVLTAILLYWRSFTRLRRWFGRRGLIATLAAALVVTATFAFPALLLSPPKCRLAAVELNLPASVPRTLELGGAGVTDLTSIDLRQLQHLTGRAVFSRGSCPCEWTIAGAVGQQLRPLGTSPGGDFSIGNPAGYDRIFLKLKEGSETHLFTLLVQH